MEIKWFGQSSFKIKSKNKNIYINPSIGIYKDEDKADIILISSSHPDNFSKEIVKQLSNDDTKIIVNRNVSSLIDSTLLNHNDEIEIDDIKIKSIPAYFVEKMMQPKEEGNGYVIVVDNKTFYHSGDTDLIPEMNLIEANVVFVPVGGTGVMDADEAASATKIIIPDIAIPMHWGYIAGTKEDAIAFRDEVISDTEIEVKILEPGDSFKL